MWIELSRWAKDLDLINHQSFDGLIVYVTVFEIFNFYRVVWSTLQVRLDPIMIKWLSMRVMSTILLWHIRICGFSIIKEFGVQSAWRKL